MKKRVLVTYATKHGATAEIAETIATVLGEYEGLKVTLGAISRGVDPANYDAIILGSAVYAGRWRGEAVKFIKTHVKTLQRRPVWIFSSGPTGAGDAVELVQGWRYPESLRTEMERIAPRETMVFHGELDPKTLNFVERFIVERVQVPVGDYRDWVAISEWAMEIAAALGARAPQPEEAVGV